MARDNRTDLPPLTLSSGKPVAEGVYTLKSGTYYRIDIIADGTAELALSGGDFFRSIWINEIVINDIEIRPMGVHSIEFDTAGDRADVVHRHRARHLHAVDPGLAQRHPDRDLRHPVRTRHEEDHHRRRRARPRALRGAGRRTARPTSRWPGSTRC